MPRSWHDRHSANKIESEEERAFYRSIVADKKPYFMRYIYPSLMKQYNTYIKNTDRNALREFQMIVKELKSIPVSELTDRQKDFLRYYDYRMPVGVGSCVMNKICRRFEEEFDCASIRKSGGDFDYSIMRSDSEYTPRQYSAIKHLYDDYNKRLSSYAIFADYERVDDIEAISTLASMNEEFERECVEACPDPAALCNVILDICYNKSSTKRFAWSMCGEQIIQNLLLSSGGTISYPVRDEDGDTVYCGDKYKFNTISYEVNE